MKLEFELWHLVLIILSLVGMFGGLGKLLLTQIERRFDERLAGLLEESRGWRSVESDVHKLRAEAAERGLASERQFHALRYDIAQHYVRREDYIRGQTVIEAKLDAISSELKNVQIKQGGVS